MSPRAPTLSILASESHQLYVGVTNDLQRLAEHKAGLTKGYAFEHGITRLVHFEVTPNVRAAIAREKQVKSWRRAKRLALIEQENPEWDDLWVDPASAPLTAFGVTRPQAAAGDRASVRGAAAPGPHQ
jgi:putative endonuclease